MGYKTKSSKQARQPIDTDNSLVVTEGRRGDIEKGKGVKYMVTEGDLTPGGEHTMQYTDVELYT